MTPKEKAKELVEQYEHLSYYAKQCSLIAVDEMAEKCGEDFRKLVHTYTNIDLWELAKLKCKDCYLLLEECTCIEDTIN